MAKYRKIDPRIWNDEKFCALTHMGKLVFLFLMTHPHMTALGAMRASLPGLAAELKMNEKAFGIAFGEAFAKGIVEHDPIASFIALPNFLKYNGPESPNVVKAWASSLDLVPECNLKNKLIQRVKGFAEALPEAFMEALPEAFAKSMPYQEQEQEQDKYISSTVGVNGANGVHGYSPDFETFWAAYPKKKGKGDAFAEWKKNRHPPVEHIVAVLERAKKTTDWIKDNGQYIPNPATWLHQRRWDDEYVTTDSRIDPRTNQPKAVC